MKRCPKCNRTYPTDTQKFCTVDGGLLEVVAASQGETIRIDSAQLNDTIDDAPTKAISRELISESPDQFDPFKTISGAAGRNRHGQRPGDRAPGATIADISAAAAGYAAVANFRFVAGVGFGNVAFAAISAAQRRLQ